MVRPLAGLRILDLSEGVAGPFAAKLLGDLGAEVLKVESPNGDWTRQLGPFPEGRRHPELSAAFFYFNTSKRGIVLDPESDAGRRDLERLIKRYDVVIAGEPAGSLAARGLGFEALQRLNPSIILTTVTGFGSEGPLAEYQWSHMIACAMGGWAQTCGLSDREPLQAGGSIAETLTGAFAASATLLAVLGRRAHGRGEHVDVSAQQAVLTAALFPTLRYEYAGDVPTRNSQYGPGPSFILPTRQGYIGINVLTGAQWELLCQFLGRPDIATNSRYAGRERSRHADEIRAAFEEAVRDRTAEDLFHEGEVWRVPFGLVPSMADLVQLTPHQERGFIVDVEHPLAGRVGVPGLPYHSSLTGGGPTRPTRPPLLGEDTADVLAELERDPPVDRATAPRGESTQPVEGLKVIDLSMFFSGPLVTQILADGGADVVKVESIQRIDGWRGSAASDVERPWERSPNFNWVNRNKRGITLNLADERGATILKRLVADADVVIENYTPRVMENFGLEYEVLREINPRLIMMSMPGFGANVSWRDYVAFGMSTEQLSGISHLTGYEDGPPIFTGTNGGDPFVGVIASSVLLAALHHRERTGEGQHIDLSQVEACTLFIGDAVTGWTLAGHDPGRSGNRHPIRAPHGIYPCRDDRWIAIECQDDEQWFTLASMLGRPDWSTPGSSFATAEGRRKERPSIDAALAEWTRERGHLEAMAELQTRGVPAGAVLSGPELLDDPQLAARDAFIAQDRPGVGIKHYPAQPYRFRVAPAPPVRRAPLLGEHTVEVLRERLALSDEELATLERDDVIGTTPIAAREPHLPKA